MSEHGNTRLMQSPPRDRNSETANRMPPAIKSPPDGQRTEATLESILEALRALRREQQHEDFSIARLGAAIAQAFAICAIGWGLFAWMDSTPDQTAVAATSATIRLLAGIAFQLMALTLFVASRRN